MKLTGCCVEREYLSGPIGEKSKYWMPATKPNRSPKRLKSDLNKMQQNTTGRIKTVARLINANFREGDCCYALSISEEKLAELTSTLPSNLTEEERQEAVYQLFSKEINNFIERYRRECIKQEIDYRYLIFISDMDGQTLEATRIHAHIIAPKNAGEIIKKKWELGKNKLGQVRMRNLHNPDFSPLAKYLVVQVRHRPNAKGYIPSRTLIVPQPIDHIIDPNDVLKVPNGAQIIYRTGRNRDVLEDYLRFKMEDTKEETPEFDDEEGWKRWGEIYEEPSI